MLLRTTDAIKAAGALQQLQVLRHLTCTLWNSMPMCRYCLEKWLPAPCS